MRLVRALNSHSLVELGTWYLVNNSISFCVGRISFVATMASEEARGKHDVDDPRSKKIKTVSHAGEVSRYYAESILRPC